MSFLEIRHSWDGEPLTPLVHTLVAISYEDHQLDLSVTAPWAVDPPPAGKAGSTPRLWEHEVVELFVFGEDGRYTEIELGPHGHWLVLRFDGVRHLVDQGHAIRYRAWLGKKHAMWKGRARIDRRLLPDVPVRCNLFRIAGAQDDRRYQALVPVPGDHPDFHQPSIGVPWPL